jgi:TATA-binding protein-associated factor
VNLPLLSGVKLLCNMTERLPVLRAVLCVQRCGVSWLVRHAALGVHGVLCDEMGLGKTLQALTAIAVDRAAEGGRSSAPSLIVCPSTLVAHWHREATRCFGDAQPATGVPPMAHEHSTTFGGEIVAYAGDYSSRLARLAYVADGGGLVVTSYEFLRRDIATLAALTWNWVRKIKLPNTRN